MRFFERESEYMTESDVQQESFNDAWVSRDEHNEILDRLEKAEHDASELRSKALKLDALLNAYGDIQAHVEAVLHNLRKSSAELLRTIEIIEEDVELGE